MRFAAIVIATAGAVIVSAIATSAFQDDMGPAEFFRRDRTQNWTRPLSDFPSDTRTARALAPRAQVARMVAAEARRQGVNVDAALRIAKVESGYRCNAVGPRTRHGRALGVMQVLPSSARALGYDGRRLLECSYGIKVGIAHMAKCRDAWAGHDRNKLARCHVGGWGRPVRTRYANRYVRMVSGEHYLRQNRKAKRALRRKLIRLAMLGRN